MSVFRNIMDRIFRGSTLRAEAAQPASEAQPGPEAAVPPPAEAGRAGGQAAPAAAAPAPAPSPLPATAAAAPAATVDVEAVLTGMAANSPQRLDWRRSIVDLLKLLDLDSSLGARKELAQELGYSGRLDGSAEMNLWLHRAVMRRLAENGGRVPDDLKD
jgi:3-oxoacyl-ACP reductase-like protein